jgi:membrane protease YdiL (CAAX protease family)
MKRLLYSFAILFGFLLLAFLFKLLIMFVYRLFYVEYDAYRTAIVGFSKVISGIVVFSILVKKSIVTVKNQLKISLHLTRTIVVLGVIISVFIRYIFINRVPLEVGNNIFLNYFLPTVLFVPVIEELIYRNGIQELLLQQMDKYSATFVASVFYSIGHVVLFDFSLLNFSYYFVFGLLLGYSLYFSGSIFVPIIISVVYNLLVLISFNISY